MSVEDLGEAYDALAGIGPLDAVARVLRDGTFTPDFLRALADRFDSTFEGGQDEFQLVLVKRTNLQKVNFTKRARRLDLVSNVRGRVAEADANGEPREATIASVMADFKISRTQVYELLGPMSAKS